MTQPLAAATQHPDYRPWYREPWVWLLIALPFSAIVGCAITIWLALSHPDYRVVDEQEVQQVESELRVRAESETARSGQENGDG